MSLVTRRGLLSFLPSIPFAKIYAGADEDDALRPRDGRWGDQGDGSFVNPILPADYSDIDAIRVGRSYIAISSTLHMSPGVVILSSPDLINWNPIGHAVPDISALGEEHLSARKMKGYGRGIWAGAIRYRAGQFYIYFTSPDSGLYVTTAKRAEGPWGPLRSIWRVAGYDDPCPFWDANGDAWMVMTRFAPDPTTGERYVISLYRMTQDGLSIDPKSALRIHQSEGSEANKLYRIGQYYYHYFSEVRAEGRVPMMARAIRLERLADEAPVQLGHVNARVDGEPNQGALLQAHDHSWWFLTHQGHGDWEGRAVCLLPVAWRDGWPIIGEPGVDGIGNMVWKSKKPIASRRPALATSPRSFGATLDPRWEWNHAPRRDRYSLSERVGWLRLKAERPLSPSLAGIGNMLTERSWRTVSNSASVVLDTSGMVDGQSAGLCHFSSSGAWIGIHQQDGERRICFSDGSDRILGKIIDHPVVHLRSDWNLQGIANFSYSENGSTFDRFGGIYAMRWQNYRGDRIGIFTFNSQIDSGHADFSMLTQRNCSQNGDLY